MPGGRKEAVVVFLPLSSCAVLCCAVLCCAVLCCAVLYCTVLYCCNVFIWDAAICSYGMLHSIHMGCCNLFIWDAAIYSYGNFQETSMVLFTICVMIILTPKQFPGLSVSYLQNSTQILKSRFL